MTCLMIQIIEYFVIACKNFCTYGNLFGIVHCLRIAVKINRIRAQKPCVFCITTDAIRNRKYGKDQLILLSISDYHVLVSTLSVFYQIKFFN